MQISWVDLLPKFFSTFLQMKIQLYFLPPEGGGGGKEVLKMRKESRKEFSWSAVVKHHMYKNISMADTRKGR